MKGTGRARMGAAVHPASPAAGALPPAGERLFALFRLRRPGARENAAEAATGPEGRPRACSETAHADLAAGITGGMSLFGPRPEGRGRPRA